MMDAIDNAKSSGDSIGGIVEVIAEGMPIGVGSYVHYDRKLDAKLAGAIMSINAFKGAEIGVGFEAARQPGSKVHDEIFYGMRNKDTREKRICRRFRRRYDNGNANCRKRCNEANTYIIQTVSKC